jgi:hypothetical protein
VEYAFRASETRGGSAVSRFAATPDELTLRLIDDRYEVEEALLTRPGLHSLRLRFNVSMSQPGAQPGSGSSIAPAGPVSKRLNWRAPRRLGQSGRSDVAARKGQAPILSPAPESGLWVVWAARGQELRGFERMRVAHSAGPFCPEWANAWYPIEAQLHLMVTFDQLDHR